VRARLQSVAIAVCLVALCSSAVAQASKPAGVLSADEVKKAAPSSYFYRGQSASVQGRNTAGLRTQDQKLVLAGMVDTSGYASDVAQKYQGFFITEVKLDIEGSQLPPGQYGFGFTADKFLITDVGANEVLSVSFKTDNDLKRPVPLKITEDNGTYRLYAGRKWVALKVQ
jgi:hypothetical protein